MNCKGNPEWNDQDCLIRNPPGECKIHLFAKSRHDTLHNPGSAVR